MKDRNKNDKGKHEKSAKSAKSCVGEGEIGRKFRPVQNRERNHDHAYVETLRDERDLLPPLSPAQHSCWREELHKAAKMRHTYFATQIIFFQGVNEGN